MPIYTYKCRDCEDLKDIHHGFDEEFSDSCKCGGSFRRVLQLSGVTFKGDGFYRNDSQTNRPKDGKDG